MTSYHIARLERRVEELEKLSRVLFQHVARLEKLARRRKK
jgi:hypothetical protein